jgi:hypothetical protein
MLRFWILSLVFSIWNIPVSSSQSSRDGSVGTTTGYELDGPVSIPDRGKVFLFFTASRPNLGPTQHHVQLVSEALPPGVKRQRREADHSPPTSAEVKNAGAIPPLPRMSSMHSASLIKHRDIFTFCVAENTASPSQGQIC